MSNNQSAAEAFDPTSPEFSANMTKAGELTQKIWQEFMESGLGDETPAPSDPLNTTPAFTHLVQAMMTHPAQTSRMMFGFWRDQADLWTRTGLKFWEQFGRTELTAEPLASGKPRNKRFAHDEWEKNPMLSYIRESYELAAKHLREMAVEMGNDLNDRDRRKVEFYTRNFIEAMNPANFAALNPEVMETTSKEQGANLVRGLEMMLKDLRRGHGQLSISQTDMDAFKVGDDMANTPGKVIFQNELFQLIQYAPTTEKVYAKPVLIIPPWINKFYILDLNEEKSFVRWLVGQGYTVFMLSWVNPSPANIDETWESYVKKGGMTAIEKVLEETGQDDLNLIAYCIGGTMTGVMASHMCGAGDDRLNSITFFTAQHEFSDPGDLQVFIDEQQIQSLDAMMEKGVLPATAMSSAFNMMRSNDLIWSYVVNNYMLGKKPIAFDLLYWNADSTAMVPNVHHYYLESFYNNNDLAKGNLTFEGKPVDLGKINVPVFHVAAREDHIAPAASVYRGAKLLTGADVTYTLSGSGHIAGIVNPPVKNKYQYWVNDTLEPGTVEEWIEGAEEHPGSWWPHWEQWLRPLAGGRKATKAREPGEVLGTIEDAPGSYVRVSHSTTATKD
ncbi:PHA/PHB synthase family protein [Paracoccaceae bacterium GXU_MW_L88]